MKLSSTQECLGQESVNNVQPPSAKTPLKNLRFWHGTEDFGQKDFQTLLLDDIYDVTQLIIKFPDHQGYTMQDLEDALRIEVEPFWIPVCKRLDQIVHHWEHYYPDLVSQGTHLRGLTQMLINLSDLEKLGPEKFRISLCTVASQFRTYKRFYIELVKDEVIEQKFCRMVDALTDLCEDYCRDYNHAFYNPDQPDIHSLIQPT
jgi:hypothetical protein